MAATPPDLHPADDEAGRAARQAEQRRIAQLLHDSLSQSLTATYWQAVLLARKMEQDGAGSAAEVGHLADMIHSMVVELREVTRLISSE